MTVHNSVDIIAGQRLGADLIEAILAALATLRPVGRDRHDQLAGRGSCSGGATQLCGGFKPPPA